MWIAKKFAKPSSFSRSARAFCQVTDSQMELHRKRESIEPINEDLLKDDLVLHGNEMSTEIAYSLIDTNPSIQQMMERKYLKPRNLSFEEQNYKFYGDNNVVEEEFSDIFKFPRTSPYRRIEAGELYKVPKDKVSDEHIRRDKAFVSELFPPFDIKDSNLRVIAEQLKDETISQNEVLFKLKKLIPKLLHTQMVTLTQHLAFEAKVNDHATWKLIQEAVLDDINLYSFQDLCKIYRSVNSLKPKRTDPELDHAIQDQILKELEMGTSQDMLLALECYRSKRSSKFFDAGKYAFNHL